MTKSEDMDEILANMAQALADGPKRERYRTLVGNFVVCWAALDARLTSAIWQIGEIPDAIGASITSQIYTFDGKVKALQAILRVRGFDREAKKVQKFADGIKDISDSRNRLVHDPVYFTNGEVNRLEITANRRLTLEYKQVDMDALDAMIDRIISAHDDLSNALLRATSAHPPLLRQISLRDTDDEQTL